MPSVFEVNGTIGHHWIHLFTCTYRQDAFSHMPRVYTSPGNMYPWRATCIRIHICRRIHVAGYKLLVRIHAWALQRRASHNGRYTNPASFTFLYLGDIVTIHLCHGRLVSLCIQQQTGDKLATILSPIQETCWRRQVDTTCIRQTLYPGVNAALHCSLILFTGLQVGNISTSLLYLYMRLFMDW